MPAIRFLFTHSLFAALCASALSWQTAALFNGDASISMLLLVFFSTIAGYNFYWVLGNKGSHEKLWSLNYLQSQFSHLLLMILSGMLVLVMLVLRPELIWPIMLAFLGTCLYSWPRWNLKIASWTKRIGFVKTILLAATWTFVSIGFPLWMASDSNLPSFYYFVGYRFLFMLLLCIIFDRRDKHTDVLHQFSSLATALSEKWLNRLSVTCLFLMLFLHYFLPLSTVQLMGSLFCLAVLSWVYLRSLQPRGFYFYYFIVDGMMVFSALVTFISDILFTT